MKVFFGDFPYELVWLDGGDLPMEALGAANGSMANCIKMFGEQTLREVAGAQEQDGQLRSNRKWYYSVTESDGQGSVTLSITQHKDLQRQIYAQARARYLGKIQKAN